MKLTNSFGILSMIFVTAGAVTVACGPDTGDGEGTGGSGETGGSTNAGGTTGSGGADATGGVSATGGDGFGGMAGYTINTSCDAIPGNLLLTDYSEYTLGAQWTEGGVEEWGGSDTLTGGDFFYKGMDASALTAEIIEHEEGGQALKLSGTVAAGDYAGYGIYFGPACNNAIDLSGISFEMYNGVGDNQLQVQIQSDANYPTETDKGSCQFTSEDTKWEECTNNFFTIEEATAGAHAIEWSQFEGGKPEPYLNPSELMGLQWQFNCGDDADCPLEVIIDNITFY